MNALLHMHCFELDHMDLLLYQSQGVFKSKYPEKRYRPELPGDSPRLRVVLEDYAEPEWSDGEENDYRERRANRSMCQLVSSGETIGCCKPCIMWEDHQGPCQGPNEERFIGFTRDAAATGPASQLDYHEAAYKFLLDQNMKWATLPNGEQLGDLVDALSELPSTVGQLKLIPHPHRYGSAPLVNGRPTLVMNGIIIKMAG